MKKFLIVLLTLIMTVSAAFAADTADPVQELSAEEVASHTVAAADEFSDANTERAYLVLSGYGVVKGYQDGTARPESDVTRAEFAAMICRLIGVAKDGAGEQKFGDVPADHWACANVNTAYDLKIVDGTGGGMYEPDAVITFSEAYKMVVSALGYKNAAVARGGYPGGYLAVAAELGLNEHITTGEGNVTRGDMFHILYNALDVDLMYNTSTDGTNSHIFDGRTLIYNFRNSQGLQLIEGVVNTVGASSMVGISTLAADQVEIDGIVCKADLQLNPFTYLGRQVIAFADVSDTDRFVLKSIALTPGRNDVTLIDAQDVISYADYRYKIINENGREETITIDPAACLIYNGTGIEEVTVDSFAVNNGAVQLIDNNSNGTVDVVFIVEYQSYVLLQTDTINNLLTLRGDNVVSKQTMDIQAEDKDRNYYFINQKGKDENLDISDAVSIIADARKWQQEDITAFEPGDIVNVLWDNAQNTTVIILSDKTVVGRANSVAYTEGDIEVDGEPYSLFAYGEGRFAVAYQDIIMDYATTFYIDVFGKVIGIDTTEITDDVAEGEISAHGYAYVLAARDVGMRGMEVQLLEGVKFVPAEPEIKLDHNREEEITEVEADVLTGKKPFVVKAKEDARVNGIKSARAENVPVNQVVEYWLNADGELSRMESLEMGQGKSLRYYNRKYKTFSTGSSNGVFMGDEDTMYFVIPTTAKDPGDYEIKLTVMNGARITIQPFGTKYLFSNGCPVALAAVISTTSVAHQGGMLRDSTPATIVTKVTNMLNENGVAVRKIYGLTNGMYEEYPLHEDLPQSALSDLKVGALAQLSVDVDGNVDNYRLIASLEDLKGDAPWYRSGARGKTEVVFGKAYHKEENVLEAVKNTLVTRLDVVYKADYSEIRSYNISDDITTNFYVYERNSRDANGEAVARLADPIDIITVMESIDSASDVVVHLCFGDVKTVVILK